MDGWKNELCKNVERNAKENRRFPHEEQTNRQARRRKETGGELRRWWKREDGWNTELQERMKRRRKSGG